MKKNYKTDEKGKEGSGGCRKYLLHNSFTQDVSCQVYSLPRSTRINFPVPKDTQSQISTKLNSLILKVTQALEENKTNTVNKAERQSNNFMQIAYVTRLTGIDVIQFLRCYLYHVINKFKINRKTKSIK